MLSVSKYPKACIDGCQRKIAAQVAAFRKLKGGAELAVFEPLVFNHLILALDRYFNHRARGQERKDGNALNEVRMLCTSIAEGEGELQKDSTIKYQADKAVLGLGIGEKIAIDASRFEALAAAFFEEMRRKFS
jgi:hypothetical protein